MLIKKISSVALMGSLLLVCGSVAAAQGQAGQMVRLKRFLALTDTQVNDIGALLRKHREAAFPLRQDLRARNHQLQNALDTAEPNPNTVGQLVIARNGLNKELRALNVKLRSDIAAVLTPEQKQKFEQMKARRGARRGRA
ncbi:MAG TPA: periplasmic heavy metal sensor [Blastocatellia bacterium]|nr:periplasmic heavy metal sensor [Blastocatellia bacterium]